MRNTCLFKCATVLLIALPSMSAIAGGKNLVRNGSFSDLDGNGKPKQWRPAFGGNGVKGRWATVKGPKGKWAVKIECTDFPDDTQTGWAIFMQDRTVSTKRSQNLYISFWARKEGMEAAQVMVAIMRLQPWGTVLRTAVPVSEEWSKVELVVTPQSDCRNARFEIYFNEVGSLYLADIRVAETTKSAFELNRVRRKMERERKLDKQKNIIWNSSFEVGANGWGTEGFDHNIVKIDDAQAYHGRASARIALRRSDLPAGYSDYPKPRRIVSPAVKFATEGWMRLKKGAKYTLSAYLRSDGNDLKAELGVYFMTGARSIQAAKVTGQWRRYTLTFTAKDIFGFAQIASSTTDSPATLWVDAVQLEKGTRATTYTTKYPVEAAFYPKRPGGIYYAGEPVVFDVSASFGGRGARGSVAVKVVDYRGQTVYQKTFSLTKKSAPDRLELPVTDNGHYQLLASVKGRRFKRSSQTRFVVIYPYAKTYGNRDARFGTNHPYYSDLMQGLAQDAGVYWVRDWSLKWDSVEPQKGRWDFSGAKILFDRARRFDLRVLAILPDPSSGWASSGPAQARGKRLGDAFADLWYLPKSMDDYRRYVRECIQRYHDRARVWEVLNEPYRGKTVKWKVEEKYNDFLRIVKEEAAQAGANQEVARCGLVYFGSHEQANTEAARLADVLSEHTYPVFNRTRRFISQTRRIEGFLKRHNVKTDIWVTEYGKYSNDNPAYEYASFNHYLANGDERTAAAYNMKYLTILFSHGVSKVFFHQRTWPIGMNRRHAVPFDMLFDYGARPFKFFVAANAMAWLLHPGTSAGVPVNETGPVFAYRFKRPDDAVLVVWTDKTPAALSPSVRRLVREVSAYGMMGNRLDAVRDIGSEPIYLAAKAERIAAIAKALAASKGL